MRPALLVEARAERERARAAGEDEGVADEVYALTVEAWQDALREAWFQLETA